MWSGTLLGCVYRLHGLLFTFSLVIWPRPGGLEAGLRQGFGCVLPVKAALGEAGQERARSRGPADRREAARWSASRSTQKP